MFNLNFFTQFRKRDFICLILIILIFFVDRLSKIKIINHQLNNNIIYINDFINFNLVWNTGIGFGLLSSNTNLVYNLITSIIGGVIILLIYFITQSKFVDKLFFSLVLGGAIGNFYDRLIYSAVPDFIDLHFKSFHWFTFNIADISITCGIIGIIVKDIFRK
jgi:signal peptidase II